MLNIFRPALAAAAIFALLPPVFAAPVPYTSPPETATFRDGPGVGTVKANCSACHSADYISTQPRGAGFGKDFWEAEVTKMITVYGAPISSEDAKIIVDYLAKAYQ